MNFLTACRAFSLSYLLSCPSYGPARCSRPVSSDRCSRGRARTCMSGVDLLLAAQCQYHPPGPLLNAEEAEALHDEGPAVSSSYQISSSSQLTNSCSVGGT